MSKNKKILIGLLTLWPIAYIFIFLASIFFLFILGDNNSPIAFPVIFTAHILTMLMSLILMIYMIINVFTNNNVKQDNKLLWVVLIVVANMFVMPIYWYMFIWKDGDGSVSAPAPPALHATGDEPYKICPSCGIESKRGAYCPKCGQLMRAKTTSTQIAPTAPTRESELIAKVIPHKNKCALIGYYFGVFSIIPLFPIGLAAFILGLIGIEHARRHPDHYGVAHAWVGIIAGCIFGFGYLIITILRFTTDIFYPYF